LARRDIDLVICDIDGTLLTHGLYMPPETIAALRAVAASGVAVATLSGRTLGGTDAASPALASICVARGALNGTVIEGADGATIASALLDPQAVTEAMAAVDAAGLSACLLGARRSHALIRHADCARIFRMFHPTYAPLDGAARPYHLLSLYGPRDVMERTQHALHDLPLRLGPICGSLRSDLAFQFLQPPGVDKGSALRRIAAHVGTTPARTLAIGDGLWNDLPLLRAAGVGVAMPAAAPALLAVADHVAPAGPEDAGAGSFLLEYLGL
jgi:hypothetical protein